jgi:DNA repair protein RecN (Recombination protein N)
MLCSLVVENYALISKLEIEFREGLTIITGETGAGKSILLGALSLILGKRADSSILYDKEKKCIVEGTFNIAKYGLERFFTENDLDYDDQPVIRREISAAGKSRAFINDIPVNLELLSDLGLKLIDIHSQHQNLKLADSIFQMKVLDSYAQNKLLLDAYKKQYHAFRDLQKHHQQLSEEATRTKSDLDYYQFQYNQLHEAHLIEGEQEELELELERLTHAEEIKAALSSANSLLQGDEQSILQQLKDCSGVLHKIGKFLQENEALSPRLESVYIETKDIAREIEALDNQINHDPARLNHVSERLDLLYGLEKKHHVDGLSELIALRDHFRSKTEEINSFDDRLEALSKKLNEEAAALNACASKLNQSRLKVIPSFEKYITDMLKEVGIPNAGFTIQIEKLEDFDENGYDSVRFLFSANKNMPPQDIARVASGGEMSRLMLCIKSLMSDAIGLPTIIFDEIDTGVSGDIAERVGNIINRMAEKMQIINITHLPQVASKGKHHFLVYKTEEGKSSVTRMKLLTPQERHLEIAKMLSGEEITHAALENAKALLGN